MNYFIFDFNTHQHLIDSFLASASLAHKEPLRTKAWFLWKFRANPFGESIMACAEENGNCVGCVAFGIQDFFSGEKKIKGALSFETFVQPEYQGKGLFKSLIKSAEKEAQKREIQLLLNFPNQNSLPGFLRLDWKQLNITEYWIKGIFIPTTFLSITELKKSFIPNASNFGNLDGNIFSSFDQFKINDFTSELNIAYLNWRFLSFPNAEYVIINDNNCYSVGRVGYRGKLKEVQVLFVNQKSTTKLNFKKVLKAYQAETSYDLISFPISSGNSIRKYLIRNFFIKVPNRTNVCYKCLDDSLNIDPTELSLNAINYHTY